MVDGFFRRDASGVNERIHQRMVVAAVDNSFAGTHLIDAAVAHVGAGYATGVECYKGHGGGHLACVVVHAAEQCAIGLVKEQCEFRIEESLVQVNALHIAAHGLGYGLTGDFAFILAAHSVAHYESAL